MLLTVKGKRKKVLLRARLSENERQLGTNQDGTTPEPTQVLGRSQCPWTFLETDFKLMDF